ncbi:MAG: hypothetical protein ACOYYS_10100 [Chloroflexota bacterium]
MNAKLAIQFLASITIQAHVFIRQLEEYLQADDVPDSIVHRIHTHDQDLCIVLTHLRQRYLGLEQYRASYPETEWIDDVKESDEEVYVKCREKSLRIIQLIFGITASLPVEKLPHMHEIQGCIDSLKEFEQYNTNGYAGKS